MFAALAAYSDVPLVLLSCWTHVCFLPLLCSWIDEARKDHFDFVAIPLVSVAWFNPRVLAADSSRFQL